MVFVSYKFIPVVHKLRQIIYERKNNYNILVDKKLSLFSAKES